MTAGGIMLSAWKGTSAFFTSSSRSSGMSLPPSRMSRNTRVSALALLGYVSSASNNHTRNAHPMSCHQTMIVNTQKALKRDHERVLEEERTVSYPFQP